jgi:cation:H+ antiporter
MQLALGLILLAVGADFMVRAAVRMAARLQVRPLIIGLTVVAFGSSAPQMAISTQAVLGNAPDIAFGSVIGSSIFSLLVTLGGCALLTPLRVSRELVRLDLPLMFGASALVFVLAFNGPFGGREGVVLLLALLGYLWLLRRQARHHGRTYPAVVAPARTWPRSVLMFATGAGLLVGGGHLLLQSTVALASSLGLSERVIGLTLVAVSASLPELATSLVATLRGQRDIAVANVVGSNLFNLLGVLGVTAVLAPLPLSISPNALDFDLPVMLGVAALTLPLFYSGLRITRLEGLMLLALYALYGLHLISFTTGMPLAARLEHAMLRYVLPAMALLVVISTWRAWRQRH